MSSLPTSAARTAAAPTASWRLFAAGCVIALSTVWFALSAGRPLAHPDEGRYAEIPREMLLSGDWITPHLNGLAYIEKPPLQYWASAAAYRIFGVSEWAARLPTLLAAWLGVLAVFLTGRRLWNNSVAASAAALLASSVLYFALGQILTLDMTFTFLMTAMLCTFCMAQATRRSPSRESGWWMLASWALLALAVLTKGVVAIVIAGAVMLIYMSWQRDWAMLHTLRPVAGTAVFIAITVPWFIQVSRANPDFLHFFFIREHLQRYLTDNAHRVEPWWYFLAILIAGVLPWLPQMGQALLGGWRASVPRGQFDPGRLLWTWCAFILIFFSLSSSKLAPYVLPIVPALALLTAARGAHHNIRALRISICVLVAAAIALPVYSLLAALNAHDPLVLRVIEDARSAVIAFVAIALSGAVLSWRALRRGQSTAALFGVAVAWFLGLTLLFASVGRDDSLRSGKALAAQIPAELVAHAPLFSVQTYDQTLPFYLRRTFFLVDMHGELDYDLQGSPGMFIADVQRFETTWRGLTDAIAVMPHRTYARLAAEGLPMRVLGQDTRRVAVSRR